MARQRGPRGGGHHYGPPYGYYGPPPEWYEGDRDPSVRLLDNEPPARVAAACHLLEVFTHKCAPVMIPKEDAAGGGMELHHGQNLTEEEEQVRQAACGYLVDYFKTRTLPNDWERLTLQGAFINLGGKPTMLPPGGSYMNCPPCKKRGKPLAACEHCHGSGLLLTWPAQKPNCEEEGPGGE